MSKWARGHQFNLHCVSELHYGVSFQCIIMRQIRELMSFINVSKHVSISHTEEDRRTYCLLVG